MTGEREREERNGRRRHVYIKSSFFLPLSRLEARRERKKKLPSSEGNSVAKPERNTKCNLLLEIGGGIKSVPFPVQLQSDHPVNITAPAEAESALTSI